MTKQEIKAAMLELLEAADKTSKDEWYATEYSLLRYGLEELAKKLKISLNDK